MVENGRIITVNSDNSISDIVDILAHSLSDQVVIDARASNLLKNDVNLRMILHYAKEYGKEIVLISEDPIVSSMATGMGMEVLTDFTEYGEEIGSDDETTGTEVDDSHDVVCDEDRSQTEENPAQLLFSTDTDVADNSEESREALEPQEERKTGTLEDRQKSATDTGIVSGKDQYEANPSHNGKVSSSGIADNRLTNGSEKDGDIKSRQSGKRKMILSRSQITIAAGILLIVLIFSTAYVFMSKVELVITPSSVTVDKELVLKVDPTIDQRNDAEGIIPGKLISVEIPYKSELKTTGVRREGIMPAVGELLLINDHDAPAPVPAGTIVSTEDGKRYEIVNSVTVPAREQAKSKSGVRIATISGTATAVARATVLGSSGNVESGEICNIDGNLSSRLRVTNESDINGGQDRIISVVSKSDVEHLLKTARERVLKDGVIQLRQKCGLDQYLLEPVTIASDLRSYEVNPPEGTDSDTVSLNALGLTQAYAVDFDDISTAISYSLSKDAGSEYDLLADSIRIDKLDSSNLSDGTAVVSVKVGAEFAVNLDTRSIVSAVAGKSIEEAGSILKESGKVTRIELRPDTKSKVPNWPFLVKINIAPIDKEINGVNSKTDGI